MCVFSRRLAKLRIGHFIDYLSKVFQCNGAAYFLRVITFCKAHTSSDVTIIINIIIVVIRYQWSSSHMQM